MAPLVGGDIRRGTEIQAAVLHSCNDARTYPRLITLPGPNEIQITIRAVGLGSLGIEPYLKENTRVSEPSTLGHQATGVVTCVGDGVEGFQIGDAVAIEAGVPCRVCAKCREGRYDVCRDPKLRGSIKSYPAFRGAFQASINHPAASCHKLPAKISLEMGSLLEPLAVAIHAKEEAHLEPTDSILIIGASTIGLSCAAVCIASGSKDVMIADNLKNRIGFAVDHGFAKDGMTMLPCGGTALRDQLPFARRLAERATQLKRDPTGFNVVFECTGTEVNAQAAIYAAREGGEVIFVGNNHHKKRLPNRLVAMLGTFGQASSYEAAIDLITCSERLPDLRKLITHRHHGLASVLPAVQMAAKTKDEKGNVVLKVVIILDPNKGTRWRHRMSTLSLG
ncbi:MAG: hypothetical protein Q9197_002805 [Variospora fuerteventurae]